MQGAKYYRRQRLAGKASNIIWSVAVTIILGILLIVMFKLLTPWFEALMQQF